MKLLKRTLTVPVVLFAIYMFLIAPKMFNKADMSAFIGGKFAHRGYFDVDASVPENSLLSFEKAIEKDFGIELDVQLSSDGVPMVFHDANLERMCGIKGNIWDYTCQQLQEMTLSGTDHTIPTFAQALELIDGKVPVIVEYKMDRVDTAVCVAGQKLLDSYNGEYCIQSFDPRVLMWYKSNAPHIIRGQLAEEFWENEKYAGKPLYVALGFMVENVATRPDYIAYKHTDHTNISLNMIKLMGGTTAAYTLKNANEYERIKDKFDIYIFDSFDISECE